MSVVGIKFLFPAAFPPSVQLHTILSTTSIPNGAFVHKNVSRHYTIEIARNGNSTETVGPSLFPPYGWFDKHFYRLTPAVRLYIFSSFFFYNLMATFSLLYFFLFCYAVPVEKVYVMAGDRVELVCDVSSTLERDYHHQADDVGASGILARSPTFKRMATTLSSGLAARPSPRYLRDESPIRQQPEHHQQRRVRIRRYNNHHRHSAGDDDVSLDETTDALHHEQAVEGGGYLVLWFFEPERKPFYR